MNPQEEKLANLESRLSELNDKNSEIYREIKQLRHEIAIVAKQVKLAETVIITPAGPQEGTINVPTPEASRMEEPQTSVQQPAVVPEIQEEEVSAWQANLEKFIGENLISKIGIFITVLGVAIGAKYAIDHELISPLTRIILGYVLGFIFTGIAVRLKAGYHNFSAVLWSGAMAIFYLITLAAFSYYDLMPRWVAFGVMAAITVTTVVAAIWYNRQVIAHMGLVGAYGVPFLLDDGSGRFEIMFSYMIIINAGILSVSLFKYWKYLHFSSFILTWLIVIFWYANARATEPSVFPALGFIMAFFLIFYVLLIGYKLINEQHMEIEDVLLLVANSGIFYGLGYALIVLNDRQDYAGLFTLVIALVHASMWFFIFRRRSKDPVLLYFTGGLALAFLTIAIPVRFDGSAVTLLLAAESVLLFYAGRIKGIALMEKFALVIIFLAMISLFDDFTVVYNTYVFGKPETRIIPVFNVNFLVSLFVIASISLDTWWMFRVPSKTEAHPGFQRFQKMVVPVVLVLIVYLSFFMEINTFKNQLYADSKIITGEEIQGNIVFWNDNIPRFGIIGLLTYTLLFCSGLSFLNRTFFKSALTSLMTMILLILSIALTLSFGFILAGELRSVYITGEPAMYYHGIFLILLRYFIILCLAAALYSLFKAVREEGAIIDFRTEFDLVMHFVILVILSNELVNWLDIAHFENSYKLGLSILFGGYSVLMIVPGILLRKKHVRIGAMALFGITLIKLFIYDLSGLDTISRTIVFLSLGILLLIMAFLYNKFTRRIFEEHEKS